MIVFKPHVHKEKKYFLKRLIGLPGDSLRIQEGKVYLKAVGEEEFQLLDEPYLSDNNNGFTDVNGDK